jgi:hypothetical protein
MSAPTAIVLAAAASTSAARLSLSVPTEIPLTPASCTSSAHLHLFTGVMDAHAYGAISELVSAVGGSQVSPTVACTLQLVFPVACSKQLIPAVSAQELVQEARA